MKICLDCRHFSHMCGKCNLQDLYIDPIKGFCKHFKKRQKIGFKEDNNEC